ncbi:MAG: hypothetical protein JW895_02095 [Thermoleophilaceae bacterium]|nr:hypothetical protein [Thermoleophilaceae bacterium]
MLEVALTLIAEGRGEDPGIAGGIAIIVGIAALVLATAALGMWTIARRRGRS